MSTVPTAAVPHLRSCPCCGLAQVLPAVPESGRAVCCRCGTRLSSGRGHRSLGRTAAFAVAALILYPLAMLLPVMQVERFGHRHESSIIDGTATLLTSGHVAIGLVVFVCSVLIPLTKLIALLVLSAGGSWLEHRHRARTYHLVELTGRWGMLDVLLVALLVAVLKLGDVVTVTPGPGAVAFAGCVLLSLLASASFDPHRLWETKHA